MKYAVIYMFTSPSHKSYIGQTIDLNDRLKKYRKNQYKSIGKKFYNAIKSYNGIENFKLTILAKIKIFEPIEDLKKILNKLEIFFIKKHDTYNNGYNLTIGGSGSYKREVSMETRKKLSNSNKGKIFVNDVKLICKICKNNFYIKPSVFRRRIKLSKSGIIFCSRSCVYRHQIKK